MKSSTLSISQSLKGLSKQGFHPPSFPKVSQTSFTFASLEPAREYDLGNKAHKEKPYCTKCPPQISLSPLPTTKLQFSFSCVLENFFPKTNPITSSCLLGKPTSNFSPIFQTNKSPPRGFSLNGILAHIWPTILITIIKTVEASKLLKKFFFPYSKTSNILKLDMRSFISKSKKIIQ